MPEATETPTPIPDIEPLEIDLGEVDIKAARRRVEDRKSKLPERKRAVLLKKALPLLTAASLFLSSCDTIEKVSDINIPSADITIKEVVEALIPEQEPVIRYALSELVYEGERRQFEGEPKNITERLKRDFDISLISPTRWMHEDNEKENLSWATEEIATVAEAISQLPASYRSFEGVPEEIYLIKTPGSSGGSGGRAFNRKFVLYLPEDFSIGSGGSSELFRSQRDELKAVVVHEWTHNFHFAYPEIMDDWNKPMGWIKDADGTWINKKPENLINDPRAAVYPSEDIALSAGLMLVNPEALSEDRLNFFLTNEYFSDWQPVIDYKESPQPKLEEKEFPPAYYYGGEAHQYDGEALAIIERAKEHFGVEITSPTRWMFGEEENENLRWSEREIGLVAEAISQLPPSYLNNNQRSPKQIILLKAPGSASEGAGGGYNGRQLVVYISETFSPDEKLHGPAGSLYGFQRDHLRAAVVHEWTHSFLEAHPKLEQEFVEKTGWMKDSNGDWANQKPDNLIHDGNADKFPGEDISVSAGLFLVNPDALPEDRLDFFLDNAYFSSWSAVQAYQESHSVNQ